MTQLGYEDPDALAWREKVARKLGGGGGGSGNGNGGGVTAAGTEGSRRVKEIGVVKDVVGSRGPVGKRTRLAAAAAGGGR